MSGKRGPSKRSQRAAAVRAHALRADDTSAYTLSAEYDDEGVWFYQAYNEGIADWAVEHGTLGGPLFNTTRMTWIKPSFAWMLYRCGYSAKHGQERVLKLKLPHSEVASLLEACACTHGGGGSKGRVQWDPARDLYSSEGKGKSTEPRKMLRERAIQIGLSRELSERFARSILAVVDVSALARRVGDAHQSKDVRAAMEVLRANLPTERPYMPRCIAKDLVRLRLMQPEEQKLAPGPIQGRGEGGGGEFGGEDSGGDGDGGEGGGEGGGGEGGGEGSDGEGTAETSPALRSSADGSSGSKLSSPRWPPPAWEAKRLLAAEQFVAKMRKHPQFSAVTETEAHVFFWKPLSAFDQWSPCRFEVDGQWYNCAEQYMMSEKAQLFGDMHTRAKILTELDPAVQKRLASAKGTLRNFDESTWERESLRIVTAGNRAKFEQNAELKAVLLATAGKLLVEASPMDAIWGIGLGVQEALERDPATWPGKNLLGQALMLVREQLLRGAP